MRRRRRLLLLGLALLAACAGTAFALSGSSPVRDEVAIDVVFDDARGLIPGQQVMVAGATVGSITDVSLTPDRKARVHMRVDRRFAPFRADATCAIKPQGLIAENYVDCVPGTQEAEPLRGRDGAAPTVPVEQTAQPVSLTDLFEVWNTPTRQRLEVLFSTLGIATAGRGEDINALLRRANPALQLARETIGQLRDQRDDLATIVDATGPVARRLASRSEDLPRLVRHTSRVMAQTASQRGALAEGLRRLPGLLREAQPSLAKLDAVMASGEPLLADLRVAAPDVNRLSADLPRLSKAARPTLRALAPVLRSGARVSRRTAPLSKLMAQYASESLPAARTAGEMLPALEARGTTGDLLVFLYNTALATARYDDQSHLLPAHVGLSMCMRYAETPNPACGALTDAPAERRSRKRRRAKPKRSSARGDRTTSPTPAPSQSGEQAPAPGSGVDLPDGPVEVPPVELPRVPDAPKPDDVPLDDLLDLLLGS